MFIDSTLHAFWECLQYVGSTHCKVQGEVIVNLNIPRSQGVRKHPFINGGRNFSLIRMRKISPTFGTISPQLQVPIHWIMWQKITVWMLQWLVVKKLFIHFSQCVWHLLEYPYTSLKIYGFIFHIPYPCVTLSIIFRFFNVIVTK